MADDYTPTTEEVRGFYIQAGEDWGDGVTKSAAEFDRWLAALRAEWEAEQALADEEPVNAEADRDSEECDGSPHLRGLLLRTIAISDLNGADSAGPVLGSRAPVVVLAHDASSLDAATTRTTPDRSGPRDMGPDATEEEP